MLEVLHDLDRTVNVVLVGYGTIGSARSRWYRSQRAVDLVAVVDPIESRRDLVAREVGEVPTFASLDEALAAVRADVVDICSPPVFHEAQIESAITRGCHVMCEKPVVTRSEAGVHLWNLARRHRRVIYPIHNYVFSPIMRFLRQRMEAPSFGSLLGGEFAVYRQVAAQGVTDWYPNWRRDPAIAGGGILFDHGTHCIYMAMRLCGRAPTRVACTLPGPVAPGSTEDAASLQLDFAGIQWRIELTWRAKIRENRYRIDGTSSAVDIRGDCARVKQVDRETVETLPSASVDSTHIGWLAPLVREAVQVIDHGSTAADRFREAILTTRAIEVAYASAAQGGEWLPLEDPLSPDRAVGPARKGAILV